MASKTHRKRKENQRFLSKKRAKAALRKAKNKKTGASGHTAHEPDSKPRRDPGTQGFFGRSSATPPRDRRPFRVVAPAHFSLTENPEEALEFFSRLVDGIDRRERKIALALSNVQSITVDTLLYLLAIMERAQRAGRRAGIEGDIPRSALARNKFLESGFLNHVNANLVVEATQEDCVQIYGGRIADPEVAKMLCVFAHNKLGLSKLDTTHLYEVIIEILKNVREHAYPETMTLPKWYAYAWFDQAKQEIAYSLLDTGDGIPSTVKTQWFEELRQLFSKVARFGDIKDYQLIESAMLDQINRSQTGQRNRGTGLPRIREIHQQGHIKSLVIVSNRGYIGDTMGTMQLKGRLKGTLFSWRIGR